LESRRVPATLNVTPSGFLNNQPVFSSIQAAVNAAVPGDTVLVQPGTYPEQVLITKDNITVMSATPRQAIIRGLFTNELSGNKALVEVTGSGDVVNGFTVSGPIADALGGVNFGVYVHGTGDTISNNDVRQINGFDGIKTGEGIQVGLSSVMASRINLSATTGTAFVRDNTIEYFQDGGIVVENAGSSAVVQRNTVTAQANANFATNCIQFSDGATGVAEDNSVTGSLFTGVNNVVSFEATGILLYFPGTAVEVFRNTVTSCDAGIVAQGALNPFIMGNSVSGCTYDGIQLYGPGTTGALVTNNTSQYNGQDGIYVESGSNTISNNTLAFNAEDGLQLKSVSGNTVSNNMVFGNARYGISQFLNAGQSNTLSGNMVFANGIQNLFP
jgi:parallel beta-helix repeat protein